VVRCGTSSTSLWHEYRLLYLFPRLYQVVENKQTIALYRLYYRTSRVFFSSSVILISNLFVLDPFFGEVDLTDESL
jgi:hypothetical protein